MRKETKIITEVVEIKKQVTNYYCDMCDYIVGQETDSGFKVVNKYWSVAQKGNVGVGFMICEGCMSRIIGEEQYKQTVNK